MFGSPASTNHVLPLRPCVPERPTGPAAPCGPDVPWSPWSPIPRANSLLKLKFNLSTVMSCESDGNISFKFILIGILNEFNCYFRANR